jgi:hypothetical protein
MVTFLAAAIGFSAAIVLPKSRVIDAIFQLMVSLG